MVKQVNPFIKMWALWIVKSKIAELVKEELKV